MFLRLGARLHDRADDLQVAVQDMFQFQADLATPTENTYLDQPAPVGQRRNVTAEVGRTHEVDDHIHPSAVGFKGDDFSKVLGFVIDGDIRP